MASQPVLGLSLALAEPRAHEWQQHQLGHWLQNTSQDGAFGREAAPIPTEPPAQFSAELLRSSLERPWHSGRPWVEGEAPEEMVSWQEASGVSDEELGDPVIADEPEGEEPIPTDDPTGEVSELVDTGGQQ